MTLTNGISRANSHTVLYIASDVRSGSTLLDMLLGSHQSIESLGEVQFLYDHFVRRGTGYSWDWLCTCGEQFTQCPFWSKMAEDVLSSTGRSLNDSETWVRRKPQIFPLLLMPSRFLISFGKRIASIRFGLDAVETCWDVFDAVFRETNIPVIVDSSKNAEQFIFLYAKKRYSMKFLHLTRDGRAVVYSKMTRADDSARKAAKNWVLENLKIYAAKAFLPRDCVMSVKYEDLCLDPQKTIDKIANFIGIDREAITLGKRGRHNVAGSPHRFNTAELNIKLDTRWKRDLDARALRTFNIIGGWLNLAMGYGRRNDETSR